AAPGPRGIGAGPRGRSACGPGGRRRRAASWRPTPAGGSRRPGAQAPGTSPGTSPRRRRDGAEPSGRHRGPTPRGAPASRGKRARQRGRRTAATTRGRTAPARRAPRPVDGGAAGRRGRQVWPWEGSLARGPLPLIVPGNGREGGFFQELFRPNPATLPRGAGRERRRSVRSILSVREILALLAGAALINPAPAQPGPAVTAPPESFFAKVRERDREAARRFY